MAEILTVSTPIYRLTPQIVVVAPTPTSSVAMPKAFAQCNAPLKSSPLLALLAADEALGRDACDGSRDVAFGFAIGMPLEADRRVGGGGASANVLPNVAARCRRSIHIGTVMAAVENASCCIAHGR